jgi:hypothetical protein
MEAGVFPFVVQLAMGETTPWGRIWATPRLIELPEAAVVDPSRKGDVGGGVVEALATALQDDDWRVRYHIMWTLAGMGAGAEPFRELAERCVADEVSNVRGPACRVLRAVDVATADGVRALMGAVDDPFAGPDAIAALDHLLREPDPARTAAAQPVADALFASHGRTQNRYVVWALKAGVPIPFERLKAEYLESPKDKWYFLGMVIEHGRFPPEVVMPFAKAELEKGRDTYIDWHLAIICKGLTRYGPKAAPVVPAVVPLLKHRDNDTREHAARLLGIIGPQAHVARPELERLLKSDPNSTVREAAGSALSNMQW